MRPAPDRQAGLTLVEMIVSIVISGILIALVAMFGRWQIESYFDIANRAALVDAGDLALRRLTRDLQAALPNSVRVDATGTFIEFIPVVAAGRYRAESGGGAGDLPLDFGLSATAASFDVLGPTVDVAAGQPVVVFNLGIPGADAYAGTNRRAVTAGAGLTVLAAAAPPFAFPFASPANRFQVVGPPVTYQCNGAAGEIRRYTGYGFLAAQTTNTAAGAGNLGAGTSAMLVNNVANCANVFTYTPGVFQRNGLVSIRFDLAANGETVQLMDQVEVLNTP